MAKIVLTKNDSGELEGLGEANAKTYRSFLKRCEQMEPGETIEFEWRPPRSQVFHRRFFVTLNKLFDMQEQFDSQESLRAWLTVGAGYCDFRPGPKGVMCAIPQSIAYSSMDNETFKAYVLAVDAFLWTPHARRFLWPHLDDKLTYDHIQLLRDEMDH